MDATKKARWRVVTLGLGVALLIGACGNPPDQQPPAEQPAQDSMETLIAAAKEEGFLRYYTAASGLDEAPAKAFQEKYGIEVEALRLATPDLASRFASEADSGAPTADVLVHSDDGFIEEMIEKGNLLAASDADIPGFPWEYPADFVYDDNRVMLQSRPWGIAWNTDKVSEADAPKTWEDLLDPKWKGQLLHVDIHISESYVNHYEILEKEYGKEFFEGLGQQDVIPFESGAPMIEALAAGEGSVGLLATQSVVDGAKERGSPVEMVVPEFTSANQVVGTVSAKAENPNAARLFLAWLMSEEGQDVLADAGGAPSCYDESVRDHRRALMSWPPDFPDTTMQLIDPA